MNIMFNVVNTGRRANRISRGTLTAVMIASAGLLSACSITEEKFTHGYVINDDTLEQIPEGASREQVLLLVGTPSTTADFGGEVFYYISQTRSRPVAFMATRIVDQNITAIYFNTEGRVKNVARYGLEDGRVTTFSTRVTRTITKEESFIGQILRGAGSTGPGIGDLTGGGN
ncbi:MAG: outer membrane protein assembly factor BamE [Cohaesibacteraceae bacterium]|nr:outer membrane protein assembly factor BamE [Cohaesibacteraceae bacterium]MBL4875397.1 outer membrane protein assembly factor BamE [Cohaesibacteraceae bacterium]